MRRYCSICYFLLCSSSLTSYSCICFYFSCTISLHEVKNKVLTTHNGLAPVMELSRHERDSFCILFIFLQDRNLLLVPSSTVQLILIQKQQCSLTQSYLLSFLAQRLEKGNEYRLSTFLPVGYSFITSYKVHTLRGFRSSGARCNQHGMTEYVIHLEVSWVVLLLAVCGS